MSANRIKGHNRMLLKARRETKNRHWRIASQAWQNAYNSLLRCFAKGDDLGDLIVGAANPETMVRLMSRPTCDGLANLRIVVGPVPAKRRGKKIIRG